MVHAFEGNTAETKTILPVIQAFAAAHGCPRSPWSPTPGCCRRPTGRDRGCRAEVHRRRPDPRRPLRGRASGDATHPEQPIPDGQIFVQPCGDGPEGGPRKRTIFYQYRADRAKRTLKGIDQQITKAEKAVAGKAAVKRNRFVQLTGATKTINRDLEAKARALAGLKGYVTNLEAPTAEYVIGAYHQLWQIEKSFRMSKTDLRGPADLPPQTRLHRGPPDHRDGRPRRQPAGSNARPAGRSRSS